MDAVYTIAALTWATIAVACALSFAFPSLPLDRRVMAAIWISSAVGAFAQAWASIGGR